MHAKTPLPKKEKKKKNNENEWTKKMQDGDVSQRVDRNFSEIVLIQHYMIPRKPYNVFVD